MSRLAEELAEKYGFTNQGYERSDFVAALNEMKERCAKEADEEAKEWKKDGIGRETAVTIAARIRSL